jgi:hypothetical protein
VRARSSGGWRVGGESAATDMNIVYLLGNGDRVLFRAHIEPSGPAELGCTFVEVVSPPRRFERLAEVVAETPTFAWEVSRPVVVGQREVATPAPPRAPDVALRHDSGPWLRTP